MKYKVYNERSFEKLLKSNGYTFDRLNGSHAIWVKPHANTISVPNSLNPMVLRRLIRENNLIEN